MSALQHACSAVRLPLKRQTCAIIAGVGCLQLIYSVVQCTEVGALTLTLTGTDAQQTATAVSMIRNLLAGGLQAKSTGSC